jgi:hypothetical protein
MPTKFKCYLLSLSLFFFWLELGYTCEGLIIYFVKTMWVMKCCIMLSLNYSFVWCTCLNWFEFEIRFEFDLKSIEKRKEKGLEIQEKRKATPWSSSRPARSLASSLPAQWDRPVNSVARLRANALAGSRALPVRSVPFLCNRRAHGVFPLSRPHDPPTSLER